jgi:TonB family protein
MSAPPLWLLNLAAWSLQVAVLALALAAFGRFFPVERPAARLALGQVLLFLVVALPLVQPWRSSASEVGWSIAPTPAGALELTSGADVRSWAWTRAGYAVVAAILLLGLSVQLARVVVGLARIRSLRRRSRAWDPPPWLVGLRHELAPRARFFVCDETATPATYGWRRPIVLLPSAFESMSHEGQRAIAAHELVHARRCDWLPVIVEELLKAALFFHPAVHWLVNRVRLAREQTVDAAVVERLCPRDVYLESLVEAARFGIRARTVPAAPFLRESHLRERVDLLLKEARMSRVRSQLYLGLTAAAVLFAVSWAVSAAPLVSAPASPSPRASDAARFERIDGAVQVKRADSPEWVEATHAVVLRADDLVRTGPAADAEIRFADGTLFTLRPDSLIQIEDGDRTPAAGSGQGPEAKAASEPKLVHRVDPVYPEDAKADKAEGRVQVEVVVGKDGAVREARAVASSSTPGRIDESAKKGTPAAMQGDPRLAKAAVEAVQGWRYEPPLKNGQAVEARMTITIVFRLS